MVLLDILYNLVDSVDFYNGFVRLIIWLSRFSRFLQCFLLDFDYNIIDSVVLAIADLVDSVDFYNGFVRWMI